MLTAKGWQNDKSFFLWIKWFAWQLDSKLCPEERRAGKFVLLLVDGHKSRFNTDMLEWALKHRILILCYPPNATAHLQSLDVSLHGPLKLKANSTHADLESAAGLAGQKLQLSIHEYMRKVIYPAWDATFKPDAIKSGFKSAGVWPFKRDAIPEHELLAARRFAGGPKLSLENFVKEQAAAPEKKLPAVPLPDKKDIPEYIREALGSPQMQNPETVKEGKKPQVLALLLTAQTFIESRKKTAAEGKGKHSRRGSEAPAKKRGKGKAKKKGRRKAQSEPDTDSDSYTEHEDDEEEADSPAEAQAPVQQSSQSASSSAGSAANGTGGAAAAAASAEGKEAKRSPGASSAAARRVNDALDNCPVCRLPALGEGAICCNGCGAAHHRVCAGVSKRKTAAKFHCKQFCRVAVGPTGSMF